MAESKKNSVKQILTTKTKFGYYVYSVRETINKFK